MLFLAIFPSNFETSKKKNTHTKYPSNLAVCTAIWPDASHYIAKNCVGCLFVIHTHTHTNTLIQTFVCTCARMCMCAAPTNANCGCCLLLLVTVRPWSRPPPLNPLFLSLVEHHKTLVERQFGHSRWSLPQSRSTSNGGRWKGARLSISGSVSLFFRLILWRCWVLSSEEISCCIG